MKKVLISLLLALSISAVNAQASGGFGYFEAGIAGMGGTKVQQRLQSNNMLGNNFTFSSPGIHVGGRGLAVFGDFLMGGSGYANTFTGSTNIGEARLGVGGGFFNVGYFIMKKSRTQLYAFVGFGGGGGNLKIENTSPLPIAFSPTQVITAGENRDVSQGGFGFEFGVALNSFVIGGGGDNSSGGFLVGLIAGGNFFPSTEWEFEANETNVSNMGNMSSFYVGITIGGGGFNN